MFVHCICRCLMRIILWSVLLESCSSQLNDALQCAICIELTDLQYYYVEHATHHGSFSRGERHH